MALSDPNVLIHAWTHDPAKFVESFFGEAAPWQKDLVGELAKGPRSVYAYQARQWWSGGAYSFEGFTRPESTSQWLVEWSDKPVQSAASRRIVVDDVEPIKDPLAIKRALAKIDADARAKMATAFIKGK